MAGATATENIYSPLQEYACVAYTSTIAPGVAETVINIGWITAHPEDFGMVIHEMTHVIQGYSGKMYSANTWLVEGEADYIGFYKYEPDTPRWQVAPSDPQKASYRDGYRATASFISYVTWKYNRGLLPKLDLALREGTYTDALWKTITGKSLNALWAEYVTSLTEHGGG